MNAPLLALLLPLVAVASPLLLRKSPDLREGVTLVINIALFVVVLSMLSPVLSGENPTAAIFEIAPALHLSLEVEPLGLIFALVVSFLWICSSIYSIGYMRTLYGKSSEGETRFWSCFAVAIFASIGIAFAANLLTLFLFYELLTLSTYPLVTHTRSPEARRSGRLYLGMLLGTSTFFLLTAIIWTWLLTGTLDFSAGGILAGKVTSGQLTLLTLLFFFGTAKTALMPFHSWLPGAMVAPIPVSALLHTVAVVKAGVFTVLKIVTSVIGSGLLAGSSGAQVVAAFAAATILIASFIALKKDSIKAILAYSTIAQLSFIVLAAALATEASLTGGALHIATHAIGKITLFFCAGAIFVASGKTLVSEIGGIGKRMPWTMAAFVIGALSTIGLPPLCGGWSKWFLLIGTLEAKQPLF
ncbi:MAG TPA: monovalent cation/H+ antiporter subunit D family protein, partial [Planctomycetes bacterium]|nr:monovalent cation/H+ antiporter subunit D family protein [Planctomycetota bacterium]